ncbi:MAG: right-handed parallel beta-helix repeat-containing protein [Bdellovibrionales bacterium]|nr:right-handed parallel beta-helix repeat-containing protein [Bdellovibrionales bacterium]
MKNSAFFLVVIASFSSLLTSVSAQHLNSDFYQIGDIEVTEYYVDPVSGDDSNDGLSRNRPKLTVTDIWNSIPQGSSLSKGYTINLLPGTYGGDHLPNYWEERMGTASHPITLQSAEGIGTVFFSRDINMKSVSYFYLLGISIKNKIGSNDFGDTFHCEDCDHILLRGNSFIGAPDGLESGHDVAHETVKFNQSQYIYIENNNIQGAEDNAIDWVAVQYGHIRSNRIHDTSSWCAYVKGGSSYILVESNVIYDCGEGGVTAGQGTGFEYMESPWIRYEANYVKIVNNVIHDVEGAGIGVNGGYGIFIAHNTVSKVGSRSHLLELVFGERSCDGEISNCENNRDLGGWGPIETGTENNQYIGNRDVIVANNVFYNPPGSQSGSQHFAIYGPRVATAAGIPSPQTSDSGVHIIGNVVWNGDNSMPLGIEEEGEGCQDSNTTCNEAQLLSENSINEFEPEFVSANDGDFRPTEVGTLASTESAEQPDIPAINLSINPIPEGDPDTAISREFSGATANERPPGAFVSQASSTDFPGLVDTPTGMETGSGGSTLSVNKLRVGAKAKRSKTKFSASATISGSPNEVTATVNRKGEEVSRFSLTKKSSAKYFGKSTVRARGKRFTITVTATDESGSDSATKSVKRR